MNIKALYDIALNKSLVESKVKARQRKLAGEGEGRVVWRCFINFNYEPISWPFRFKIFGLEFGVWRSGVTLLYALCISAYRGVQFGGQAGSSDVSFGGQAGSSDVSLYTVHFCLRWSPVRRSGRKF